MQAGDTIPRIMQWAWDCGLIITTDHRRQYSALEYQGKDKFAGMRGDPSAYNIDTQFRKREECWPVIRFTHPLTNRHQEIMARDFNELWSMLSYTHKKIFADLGCPEWPTPPKSKDGET